MIEVLEKTYILYYRYSFQLDFEFHVGNLHLIKWILC